MTSQRKNDEAITRHLYRDKFKNWPMCLYCGQAADHRDHVLPVSKAAIIDWTVQGLTRQFKAVLVTVPACSECNTLAGSRMFDNFFDKRKFIQDGLRTKYQKFLKQPIWTEEELDELGPTLRSSVETSQNKLLTLHRRITWPRTSLVAARHR